MPWFKVDDGLAFHRKVVAAGNPAMGLWVRSGAWAAHELTDGFVPDHMVSVIGTPAQAQRLVKVGLWMRADGGFQFHEWNEPGRQPTAVEVRAEREQNAARQAEFRKKRRAQKNLAKPTTLQDGRTASEICPPADGAFPEDAQVDETSNGVTPPLVTPLVTGGVTGAPTRPDPTRPSPYGEGDVDAAASLSAVADATPEPEAEPLRDDVEQLVGRLCDRLRENDVKIPAGLVAWRKQARLLLDRDKRDLTQALRLIDWATGHHFWTSNIHSMPKFRDKYDQLLAQARQDQRRPATQAPRRTTDDKRAAIPGLVAEVMGTSALRPDLRSIAGGGQS